MKLDHLIITLTQSMITFSELESQVCPFVADSAAEPSTWDRLKFAWREDRISILIPQLESHKLSIMLMLSILQCKSDEEAWRSQERLRSMFEELLEQNQDMRSRLAYLESSFSATVPLVRESLSDLSAARRESSVAYGVEEMLVLDTVVSDGAVFSVGQRRAFEEILENTKVYKRTRRNSLDASIRSSMVRTHAWSIFSELSLADVSVQSVIALPLFPEDGVNPQWYIRDRKGLNQQRRPSLDVRIKDEGFVAGSANELIGLAISTAGNDRIELSSRIAPPRVQPLLPPPRYGSMFRDLMPYKIAVFGDGGAGKSQLTLWFCSSRFVDGYDPTIEDSHRKEGVIDGEFCALDIIDTAGTEEYSALRAQWIRAGEGFVIVYRITSRESFSWVETLHSQIKRVRWYDRHCPIMLAASHCDQITGRQVSTKEGRELAKRLDCEFLECSAKNGINVEKVFYGVVRLIRRRRRAAQTRGENHQN